MYLLFLPPYTGGDIFANKDWRTILSRLAKYGYRPFISTKIPLTETDIKFLISIGIREIQFSLDSIKEDELFKIVKMSANYVKDAKRTLSLCDKYGIKLNIRSVLTKFNSSLESMNELFVELNKHKSVYSWILTPAFYSAYQCCPKRFYGQ